MNDIDVREIGFGRLCWVSHRDMTVGEDLDKALINGLDCMMMWRLHNWGRRETMGMMETMEGIWRVGVD